LITQLQHACDELEDENEIAILKKYNYTAKYYTITLACKIFSELYIFNLYIFYFIIGSLSFNINSTFKGY